MQAKLHRWAADDPGLRFDDLFNLVYHPDFLTVAWERVRGNKGARTAGVDRVIPRFISDDADVVAFLGDAREQLKTGAFAPLPVRERMIPKAGQPGKLRVPWQGASRVTGDQIRVQADAVQPLRGGLGQVLVHIEAGDMLVCEPS